MSASYFVAIAAVELGYFAEEGLDAAFVPPPPDASRALRDGDVDLYGASPYVGLKAFPNWQGARLLCALSQGAYWVLAVRANLEAIRSDLHEVKGLRLMTGRDPGVALKKMLATAGVDLECDRVQIVAPPWPADPGANLARQGARAIDEDVADGFWGNALRAEYAVRKNLATVLADIRHGDGPPVARRYTFPALLCSEQFVQRQPEAAAATVRAIVKTQRALKADPSLATRAASRLFPAEEAAIMAAVVARDAPFYDARISAGDLMDAAYFAREVGLLTGPVNYEEIVPSELRPLWTG